MSVQLNERLSFSVLRPDANLAASVINISIDLLKKNAGGDVLKLEASEMTDYFISTYKGQVLRTGQQLAADFNGTKLECLVGAVEQADSGNSAQSANADMGLIVPNITTFAFAKRAGSTSKIAVTGGGGGGGGGDSLFRSGFDFEKMGIGGLGAEFQKIFRRAFASRLYPASLAKEMGFSHVKGILLYGPPGCGKVCVCHSRVDMATKMCCVTTSVEDTNICSMLYNITPCGVSISWNIRAFVPVCVCL